MDSRLLQKWVTQLRKGLLEFCVLNAIRAGRAYGYDIVRRLRGIEGLMINEGTVYPILSRLKRQDLVRTAIEESPEGPARKYYQLTEKGEQLLSMMNEYWSLIENGISSLKEERRS